MKVVNHSTPYEVKSKALVTINALSNQYQELGIENQAERVVLISAIELLTEHCINQKFEEANALMKSLDEDMPRIIADFKTKLRNKGFDHEAI